MFLQTYQRRERTSNFSYGRWVHLKKGTQHEYQELKKKMTKPKERKKYQLSASASFLGRQITTSNITIELATWHSQTSKLKFSKINVNKPHKQKGNIITFG